ncbi:hypothetical protein LOAG_03733 [Loa loa]|uniref:G-protein coupled receptors family 1 profile domain-containing protein n=2 Tax=Loa loa TaxID=7209 RepID=A0A1S0U480_LOALO|nr:hypothetical protein LOAG_03733 [Loa loa]EFO24750.1 hypothetical protein LOAG_03733 [Loa loa]
MDSVKCAILINFSRAPLKCIWFSFIAITIERFIAMCFYQYYEKWNYPITLACIPLMWYNIALSIKDAVLIVIEGKKGYESYCASVTNRFTVSIRWTIEVPLLIGILSLLLITRIISRRKMILQMRVSMDTLSSRYQIRENMKTSKTMFIATIMFIVASSFILLGRFFLKYRLLSELLHFAIFKETVSLVIPIFINAISVLFIVRVEQIHCKTFKWLLHFGCGSSNRVGEQMNQPISGRQHIEIIEQMWKKEIRK